MSREREIVVDRIMEYAIGSVIVAVAGVEGMMNEMLQGAEEQLRRATSSVIDGTDTRAQNLTPEALTRWSKLWARGIPGQGYNALEKIQLALDVADLPALPAGEGSAQDLKALIRLRNELVHSVPIPRRHGGPLRERDKLERMLVGKFTSSTVVPESYSFIWYRCLSADCARWAVYTAMHIRNDLFKTLGIPITMELDLPKISA